MLFKRPKAVLPFAFAIAEASYAASNVTITGTAPGGAAGGDLTGSYPNPNLGKINGTILTVASIATGNYLRYNGSIWQNSALVSGDITTSLGYTPINPGQMPANCSSNQTLTFSSPIGTWACSAIGITGTAFGSQVAATFLAAPTAASGVPTFRGIASSDLPSITSGLSGILPVVNGGTGTSNGSISGTSALTFAAGGSNQNVTLTPSGSGYTLLNGNVGIGTTSPGYRELGSRHDGNIMFWDASGAARILQHTNAAISHTPVVVAFICIFHHAIGTCACTLEVVDCELDAKGILTGYVWRPLLYKERSFFMEWLVVAVIGVVLGEVASMIGIQLQMPRIMCPMIGTIGAFAGGALNKIVGVDTFGPSSFYFSGTLLSIGFLGGALVAFWLIHRESRV